MSEGISPTMDWATSSLEKLSDVTYQIKNTRNGRVALVHFDHLKKCHPNTRLPQPSRNSQPLLNTQTQPNHPRPVGSDLELLDTDEQDHPNGAHRYPTRSRRPPEWQLRCHGLISVEYAREKVQHRWREMNRCYFVRHEDGIVIVLLCSSYELIIRPFFNRGIV